MVRITAADVLCLCPVTQQIVGGCTVLSNIGKTLFDFTNLILTKFAEIYSVEKQKKHYAELVQKNPHSLDTGVTQLKEEYSKLRQGIWRNIDQQVHFIGIGILRAIPIVGTVYSMARILEPERNKIKEQYRNEAKDNKQKIAELRADIEASKQEHSM